MASSSSPVSTFQDTLTAYAVSWEPSDDDDDWPGESVRPPTIERTIRNLTDGSLTVTFVPEQGIVWCEDLFADPNNWEKKVLERFIGPQAQIAFWIDGNSAKEICGKLIFHDANNLTHEREYRKDVHHITIYSTSADGNPNPENTDSDREDDQEDETNSNPYINPTPYPTNFARGSDKEDKRGTIVVVGRYGSGKSTLLNALAGVHWSFVDGQFVAHPAETELFHSAGRVDEPVTLNGHATTIDTFDGRTINVIDTPSYKDRFNAEQFDNRYILTDTLRELEEISALVIVMNYRDPHVTHGFVESLVGVPRSFKQRQMNVILVFTNCSGKDLAVNPGQAVIVRRALGFESSGDPDFPIFYMDEWKFQSLTDDARHTITNLTKFLDLVSDMPKLSCMEFEEMRTLSQFERTMRGRIQAYFQPSESEEQEGPSRSGFENTLYSWALEYQDNNQKLDSAVEFAEGLCANLQKRIVQDLPEEIRRITGNVAPELQCFKFKVAPPRPAERHSAAKFVLGAVGRFMARFAAVVMVIVGCHANFDKASVIVREIVVRISDNNAPALSQANVAQFTDHVDRESEKFDKMYRS